MTTVTIKETFDMSNGKKRADMCLEFDLVSFTTQRYGKTESKLIKHFNRTV